MRVCVYVVVSGGMNTNVNVDVGMNTNDDVGVDIYGYDCGC